MFTSKKRIAQDEELTVLDDDVPSSGKLVGTWQRREAPNSKPATSDGRAQVARQPR